MDQILQKMCDDFVFYRDFNRDQFKWSGSQLVDPLCAYIYLDHHQEPNEEMISLCKKILKENAGIFSAFRGNGNPILVTMLAVADDPGLKMETAKAAYEALRRRFGFSDYLPFLAMIMPDAMPADQFDAFTERTWVLYDTMHEIHSFLTSTEDVIYAGLLVMENKDTPQYIDEMEYLYDIMHKNDIFHANAQQSLSHALTLCQGSPDDKYNNLLTLCAMLRNEKIGYSKDYDMIPLGVLANIGIGREQIFHDLVDVYDYLEHFSGYGGAFGFSKKSRLVHACLILCAYYSPGTVELASAVTISVLMQIKAQQAAAASAAV